MSKINTRILAVSRNPDVANDLSTKFRAKIRRKAEAKLEDEQLEYSIGKLLGYTKKSTDYFLERLRTGLPEVARIPESYGDIDHFNWHIVPPDQAGRDEVICEYIEPLREATEILTPNLYRRVVEVGEEVRRNDKRWLSAR